MKLKRAVTLGLAAVAVLMVPVDQAAANPPPEVRTVELHSRADGRAALLIWVRHYRAGGGRVVFAWGRNQASVIARSVDSKAGLWRIGRHVDGGAKLIRYLDRRLLDRGTAPLVAGAIGSPLHPGGAKRFDITAYGVRFHGRECRRNLCR